MTAPKFEGTPTPELLKSVVSQFAVQDPEFRAQLLADPRAAVERVFGHVPAQIKLNVVQEGPNDYTIVVPHVAASNANGELSDADLESVAGGSKAGAQTFFSQTATALIQANTLGLVTYNPQSGSVIVGMGVTVPGMGGVATGKKLH